MVCWVVGCWVAGDGCVVWCGGLVLVLVRQACRDGYGGRPQACASLPVLIDLHLSGGRHDHLPRVERGRGGALS